MTQATGAVVEAGPAGSTAARLLAARGAKVTLFEARRLPRVKLCGRLTPKAQRLVPREALEAVERPVDRVELRGFHFSAIDLVEPAATIAMVDPKQVRPRPRRGRDARRRRGARRRTGPRHHCDRRPGE